MSNHFALHSVGESLMTFLRNAYPEELRDEFTCEFKPISTGFPPELPLGVSSGNDRQTLSSWTFRSQEASHWMP